MVIIYTIAGVAGFLLSSLAGYVLGGMPIPFLSGGRLTSARQRPSSACSARWCTTAAAAAAASSGPSHAYALILFVFGLIMAGIDNYAHAGGFVGGYAAGIWLDPLKPERMDHFVGAVLCLLATVLAIVASLVTRPAADHPLSAPPATSMYKSMIRAIARWQTRQKPTGSRVNMMQSASGR